MAHTRRWRASTAALLLAIAASQGGLVVSAASAHDGGGEETADEAAAHAAEDLVGESMNDIVAATKQRRAELLAADPDSPGLTAATTTTPAAQAAAAANPGQVGQFSAVVKTPVVPVFDAVLPNGKVLMWDSVNTEGPQTTAPQTSTRAAVWDPTTNTSKDVALTGYNIFCAGYTHLPNGDVLVVGGNKNSDQDGIVQTHVFHWQSETWTQGPDMASERWYPSVAALGNGEAVIVGGSRDATNHAEVYQTDGTLRQLIGFDAFPLRDYSFLVPRSDGDLSLVGPTNQTERYDVRGNGRGSGTADPNNPVRDGNRDDTYRAYGSFATYGVDKTIVLGGGQPPDGNSIQRPLATSMLVDTSGATTKFTPGPTMAYKRRLATTTLLADGSVLVTGGMDSTTNNLVDLQNSVKAAERWDPATNTWTTLASAAKVREYHSAAVLLPDGRVMTGGGGVCGECLYAGYLEQNIEYFSPPYLFDKTTGQPAVRPQLSGVPGASKYAAPFSFSAASANPITKVGLVRLGAETHGVDQGQKYVPLSFTRTGTTVTATSPASNNIAAPGYYMLFAVDSKGVPSVASIVHLSVTGISPTTSTPTPAPTPTPVGTTPISGTTPPVTVADLRCLAANGRGRGATALVRWDCRTAPTWTKKAGTLRTSGRCLTIGAGSGGLRADDKVTLSRCTGGPRQRVIQRGSTVRPAAAPRMCVTSTRSGLVLGDKMDLQACRGTTRQQFLRP